VDETGVGFCGTAFAYAMILPSNKINGDISPNHSVSQAEIRSSMKGNVKECKRLSVLVGL
jgi:hypothetical protein